MQVDDHKSQCFIRRAMVARIATLSRNGRPSINPLYFVSTKGVIWLGTDDWTLAARNVSSDARVSVLFALEKDRLDQRILRVKGRARICKDQKLLRSYNIRVAFKYILTPAGILNLVSHIHKIPFKLTYNAQGKEKGVPCIIEVTSEQVEFL
jgi:hypothetical protein